MITPNTIQGGYLCLSTFFSLLVTLEKLKYGRQLTVTASTRYAWSRVIKQLAEICSDEVENTVSLKVRLVRGIR
jgi:hypothetical protein